MKQGLFISFLVVPMAAILSDTFEVIEVLIPISAIPLFFGGTLRMVYTLMFESSNYSGIQLASASILTDGWQDFGQKKLTYLSENFHRSLFQAHTRKNLLQSETEELRLLTMVSEGTTMLFEERSPIKERTTRFEESLSSSENIE